MYDGFILLIYFFKIEDSFIFAALSKELTYPTNGLLGSSHISHLWPLRIRPLHRVSLAMLEHDLHNFVEPVFR